MCNLLHCSALEGKIRHKISILAIFDKLLMPGRWMRYVYVRNWKAVRIVVFWKFWCHHDVTQQRKTITPYEYSPNNWIYRKTDYRYQMCGAFIAEMSTFCLSLWCYDPIFLTSLAQKFLLCRKYGCSMSKFWKFVFTTQLYLIHPLSTSILSNIAK